MMLMMMATLSMDGREGGRDKKNKGSRDNSHFTPSFQCRQTDHFLRSCFLPLSPLNDNKIYTLCTRSGGLQQEE